MKKRRLSIRKILLSVLVLLVISTVISCTSDNPGSTEQASVNTPAGLPDNTPSKEVMPVEKPTAIPTEPSVILLNSPADLEGVAIRLAHPFGGDVVEVLTDIARQYSLSNPWGIWVDVEAYGGEKALVSALSDFENENLPTLIALHPYELTAVDMNFETIDLAPYFSHPEYGFSDDAQTDIPDVFLKPYMNDGQLIGLPFAPQATVNFYNQTWANDLGFEAPPQDEKAFRQQSLEATLANLADTNEDNDGTGGWIINYDPNVLASWYASFGGDLPLDSIPSFDNQAGLDTFGFLKSIYDEGYIWISRQPEPFNYFANRYALMYASTLDQIPLQTGWNISTNNLDEWTVFGFPGSEETVMFVDGPALMISKSSPEKQMAAWLFARHLLEPEVQAELVKAMFTLPVRKSSETYLSEFSSQYPQWEEAFSLLEIAQPLPNTKGWGIGQWLLQDAALRIFPGEATEIPQILDTLDATINEFEEMAP
jgi:ABC-type glycerol-3-phosphate transport system substrate-binding protein